MTSKYKQRTFWLILGMIFLLGMIVYSEYRFGDGEINIEDSFLAEPDEGIYGFPTPEL